MIGIVGTHLQSISDIGEVRCLHREEKKLHCVQHESLSVCSLQFFHMLLLLVYQYFHLSRAKHLFWGIFFTAQCLTQYVDFMGWGAPRNSHDSNTLH